MYGLILQAFIEDARQRLSDEMFGAMIEHAEKLVSDDEFSHCCQTRFEPNVPYNDQYLYALVQAVSLSTFKTMEKILEEFAPAFLEEVTKVGLDQVVNRFGRDFNAFLSNLDMLHEYLRHTFPMIRPPSFVVLEQSPDGMKINYRSGRCGLSSLASALVKCIAEKYYGLDVLVTVEKTEVNKEGQFDRILSVSFDNLDHFYREQLKSCCVKKMVPLNADHFVTAMMPFQITFVNEDNMVKVVSIGPSLRQLYSNCDEAISQDFFKYFTISTPKKDSWNWEEIARNAHNIFVVECMLKKNDKNVKRLKIKGQMLYIKKLKCFIFYGQPELLSLADFRRYGITRQQLSNYCASRFVIGASIKRRPAIIQNVEPSMTLGIIHNLSEVRIPFTCPFYCFCFIGYIFSFQIRTAFSYVIVVEFDIETCVPEAEYGRELEDFDKIIRTVQSIAYKYHIFQVIFLPIFSFYLVLTFIDSNARLLVITLSPWFVKVT